MNFKKNNKFIILLLILLMLILTSCGVVSNKKTATISRTEFLMDTVMTIRIYHKSDKKILDKAFDRLKEIEAKMSSTIETSEVSNINNNAGIKPVTVSPDTYFVIKEAKRFAELSLGAFDPTIGPLVDLWDIKAGERERDFIPSNREVENMKTLVNYKKLELLDNNQVFLKEKNMKLALGSIVKGYATDEVKKVLSESNANSAIIDLGGNVFAHGVKEDDMPWKIGIQNPFGLPGEYLGVIRVKDKSVVTSGDYERYFFFNGEKYNHIIDPSTGYPVNNEITGVSIITARSIDADALSTTLFVLGLDKGIELINSTDYANAIFITKAKEVYIGKELKDKFDLIKELISFIPKEY